MKIQPRLFLLLTLGFIVLTGVGTLSHEVAHYLTMKHFGYRPKLHYASSSFGPRAFPEVAVLDSLYKADKSKITAPWQSPQKARFTTLKKQFLQAKAYDEFICRLAGPLHTVITGLIGFVLLIYRKGHISTTGMAWADWFCVLLTFFWSRQVLNLVVSSFQYLINSKERLQSDEPQLSLYLDMPWFTLTIATGCLAAIALSWIVLFIIPLRQRPAFITACIAGIAIGWVVYMHWLGPILLP